MAFNGWPAQALVEDLRWISPGLQWVIHVQLVLEDLVLGELQLEGDDPVVDGLVLER